MKNRSSWPFILLLWIALVIFYAVLLAGCGLFPKRAGKQPAVNENCDVSCRMPCDATVPMWAPADPDDAAAWDEYPKVVVLPLVTKLEACDAKRVTCVQCLDRLKAAGITK